MNKPALYAALARVPRFVNDRAAKRFVDLLSEIGTHVNDAVSGLAPAASGVSQNLTSIVLTPGEWDVFGFAAFAGGTFSFFQAGSSVVSATLNPWASFYYTTPSFSPAALKFAFPTVRFKVTGPANETCYLVSNIVYSVAPDSLAGNLGATKMG